MNKRLVDAYISMTKPSITGLVLVTTALGFYFAEGGIHHLWLLCSTLLGSALSCGGASVLNQYLERDVDALMKRTRKRPIPTGLIKPAQALSFGIILILAGISVLYVQVNLLTAFLSLLTCFLYIMVYTPMKRLSWLNTTIGAIPGALPAVGGWTAASNHLDLGAWVLFLIMFAWQHPHFYSIAWLFKEDYKKAGFKMLPVIYPDGRFTFNQIIAFTFALIAFSIVPTMMGMTGNVYFLGALVLGGGFLYTGFAFSHDRSLQGARKVLMASVVYLPLLFGLIVLDGLF